MISTNESTCPNCGGELRYYDKVRRIVRTKNRETSRIEIRRLRCNCCGRIHREIPSDILPYKQYETEIIIGVLEGLITPYILGFEDYPCEQTMERWKNTPKLQLLLWKNY